jgi:hypothetical protein
MDNRTATIGLVLGVLIAAGAVRGATPSTAPEPVGAPPQAAAPERRDPQTAPSAEYRRGRVLVQEYLGDVWTPTLRL